jgi:hypothetical protein
LRITTRILAVLAGFALAGLAPAAQADEPHLSGVTIGIQETDFLTLGAGGFDVNDDETSGAFRAEYRSNIQLWIFEPIAGALANTDGGVFGYGGFQTDIYIGRRFVITPQATIGAYHEGSSKDLGGVFQFRTGGEIAYRFGNRARLGISFHHISNAGIYDDNPGTENLLLTFSIPLHSRAASP